MKLKKEKKPLLKEPPKKLLIVSQTGNSPYTRSITDFFSCIKKETVKYLDTTLSCLPSSDNTSQSNGKLEEQMKRLGASLFVYVNLVKSGKIRLIFGRTHEYQIIDIAHFDMKTEGSLGLLPIESTSIALTLLKGRHSSPRVQNLLLDIFRDALPTAVSIAMCTRAHGITIEDNKITIEIFKIEQTPLKFISISPVITLEMLSNHHCDESIFNKSKRTIRQTEKKIKNIEKGNLNSTLGIIHIEKQDLSEVKLSKGKALRG